MTTAIHLQFVANHKQFEDNTWANFTTGISITQVRRERR